MKVLITGACGFVGSRLALALAERIQGIELVGFDNLIRPGSESNRTILVERGVNLLHGDLRSRSDLDSVPGCDWVVDAAANPSVLAGVDGRSSSRQLSEHNLFGTVNLLEYCRQHQAGLVLLSTSRVYSVRDLAGLPIDERGERFVASSCAALGSAASPAGITEEFPTRNPISLYGATKLASEVMAMEYGLTFHFPVWIDRCGVLAGGGQFGTAEQGIFSYWLHAHAERRPLRFIGFGGRGYQVRDAFHPSDLADLLCAQFNQDPPEDPIFHASGGAENSMSLAELTAWCNDRFGPHVPQPDLRPRPFDIPWLVMDHSRAQSQFGWRPKHSISAILEEIAQHVAANPGWLARCGNQ